MKKLLLIGLVFILLINSVFATNNDNIENNLEHWWTFDDGHPWDDYATDNATLNRIGQGGSTTTTGVRGLAIDSPTNGQFYTSDGGSPNDFQDLNDIAGNFSVSGFWYIRDNSVTQDVALWEFWDSVFGTSNDWARVANRDVGNLPRVFVNGGGTKWCRTLHHFNQTHWYHFTFTYNHSNENMTLWVTSPYENGSNWVDYSACSGSVGAAPNFNGANLWLSSLGSDFTLNGRSEGDVDEVMVFNDVLTRDDSLALANNMMGCDPVGVEDCNYEDEPPYVPNITFNGTDVRAFYQFENNLEDSSANNHDILTSSGITYAAGEANNSWAFFGGDGDYAQTQSTNSYGWQNNNDKSMCLWTKSTDFSSIESNIGIVETRKNPIPNDEDFIWYYRGNNVEPNYLAFYMKEDGFAEWSQDLNVSQNLYYCWVCDTTENEVTMYTNGIEQQTHAITDCRLRDSTAVSLGGDFYGGNIGDFTGYMDNWLWYDGVLNGDDVLALYENNGYPLNGNFSEPVVPPPANVTNVSFNYSIEFTQGSYVTGFENIYGFVNITCLNDSYQCYIDVDGYANGFPAETETSPQLAPVSITQYLDANDSVIIPFSLGQTIVDSGSITYQNNTFSIQGEADYQFTQSGEAEAVKGFEIGTCPLDESVKDGSRKLFYVLMGLGIIMFIVAFWVDNAFIGTASGLMLLYASMYMYSCDGVFGGLLSFLGIVAIAFSAFHFETTKH